jgi:hypothetical protein
MKTTILSVVLFASVTFAKPQPGLPFLLVWPTARSTALAGAVTGLADDPDAAFFNPAGLAFQSGTSATTDYADWLPGLYPGMRHGYVAGTYALPAESASGRTVVIGLEATHLNLGRFDSYTEPPEHPEYVWRAAPAVAAALGLSEHFAVGLKAKYIHSNLSVEWAWERMPELGIEFGGTGRTWACDAGILWKPSDRVSVGGSVVNLGPGISYPDWNGHAPLPAMLRLGACWTPVSNEYVRINVLPEFDKLLVGMFFDTAGTETFGHELQTELRDAWKSLGVEVTGLEFVTLRLGYFEDISWQRGGIVFERDRGEYHHNVYDLLTRRNLGEFKSIGLCWGFGIGYKDYFRLDVSSDAAIYDFPTKNWKFSLVANDIASGIRELKQVRRPWEE